MDRPLVLVVDDDDALREMLKSGLERQGYRVVTAGSGSRMREFLESMRPDAIVMDVSMPNEDGITLTRGLRLSPATAETPVIMLTAYDDRETFHDAMLFGATDFLPKPFDFRDLDRKLADCIAKHRAKRGEGK